MKATIRLLLCTAVLSTPSFVSANSACDDLWFVRNQIFDQQGFCFSTPLGMSIFDNSDCSTNSTALSETDQKRVADIVVMEAEWGCNTDTSRNTLDIHSFEKRQRLTVQPLHDFTESSCIGYFGETIPLLDGPNDSAIQIGEITKGSDILSAHTRFSDELGEWWFVSQVTLNGTTLPDIGWTKDPLFGYCEATAG